MLNRVWSIAIILAVLATSCILFLKSSLDQVNLLPDQGAAWYFWKRPDPNFASQASAWGGYLAHQFFIWAVIIWAKKNREVLKDRTKLHFINWIALAGTAAFGVLHFFQTCYLVRWPCTECIRFFIAGLCHTTIGCCSND